MKRISLLSGLLFTALMFQACGYNDGGASSDPGVGANSNIDSFCGQYVSAAGENLTPKCAPPSNFQGNFDSFITNIRNEWQAATDAYCATRAGQNYAVNPSYLQVYKRDIFGSLLDVQTFTDPKIVCSSNTTETAAYYYYEFVSASSGFHPTEAEKTSSATMFDLKNHFNDTNGYNSFKFMATRAWRCTTLFWCQTHVNQNYAASKVYLKLSKLNASKVAIGTPEEIVDSGNKCAATKAEIDAEWTTLGCK